MSILQVLEWGCQLVSILHMPICNNNSAYPPPPPSKILGGQFWAMGRFKGIFSDSNNIFLWHESEDINEKSLFPKFQLIPILSFQVMHDYVCFIAPIDYCVFL